MVAQRIRQRRHRPDALADALERFHPGAAGPAWRRKARCAGRHHVSGIGGQDVRTAVSDAAGHGGEDGILPPRRQPRQCAREAASALRPMAVMMVLISCTVSVFMAKPRYAYSAAVSAATRTHSQKPLRLVADRADILEDYFYGALAHAVEHAAQIGAHGIRVPNPARLPGPDWPCKTQNPGRYYPPPGRDRSTDSWKLCGSWESCAECTLSCSGSQPVIHQAEPFEEFQLVLQREFIVHFRGNAGKYLRHGAAPYRRGRAAGDVTRRGQFVAVAVAAAER